MSTTVTSRTLAVSASTKPLAALVRQAFERRSALRADGVDAPLALTVITWEDLADADGGRAPHALCPPVASGETPAVIVFVPYASFVRGGEPIVDRCAESLSIVNAQPHVTGLIVTPMLLVPDWTGDTRGPSAVQRILRVARVLADEVTSKVPEYFTAYPLRLHASRDAVPNVAPIDAVVDDILDWIRDARPSAHTRARLWQQSLVPWERVNAAIRTRLDLSCEVSEDRTTFTAVDDLFDDVLDLMLLERAGEPASRGEADARRIDGDTESTIGRIVAAPPHAGETAYEPLRTLDLTAVRGLTWTGCDPDAANATCERGYYAGGDGPAVLFVSPFVVESGYFAGLAEDLLRDHRVLIWQPAGEQVSSGDAIAGLSEVLATEAPAGVHVVAWCAGSLLASALMAESAARVHSVTLLAPDFGDTEASDSYRAVIGFCRQLAARPEAAADLIAQANQSFRRAASAGLDQYQPRDGRKRSPLRFHPVGFWSTVPDSFNDPAHALAWARGTVENLGALESSARRLLAADIPKLVVFGTDDAMILPEVVRRRVQDVPGCETVALLGGNHSFLLEHAPLVGDLLRQFVRGRRVDRHARIRTFLQDLP